MYQGVTPRSFLLLNTGSSSSNSEGLEEEGVRFRLRESGAWGFGVYRKLNTPL